MQGLLHEHAVEQRQRQREAKGVDSYPRAEADRGAGSPLDAAAVVGGGAPEPRVSPEPGAGPEPGGAVGGIVGDVLGGAGSPDDAAVKAPALRGAGAASVVREGG